MSTVMTSIISDEIFPCITGHAAFVPPLPHQINIGYQEVAVFEAILSHIRPKCAIEIGTASGAKLSLISRYSDKAFSIDCEANVKDELSGSFPNVEFLTGDSRVLIPELIKRLDEESCPIDFIYLDANHSEEFVRRDLESILNYTPRKRMILLMHDTFNPECRRGIRMAPWKDNPHCHFVDLDFSPGCLHPDPDVLREMWGGLGFALFLPRARNRALEVLASHEIGFQASYRQSIHFWQDHRRRIHTILLKPWMVFVRTINRWKNYVFHNCRPARWWRNR